MLERLFGRWRKRNTPLQNYTWIMAAVFAFAIPLLFTSITVEQQGAIGICIFFAVNVLLAILINRFLSNTIVGGLRFDYKDLEWQVRKRLTDQSIMFNRKVETESVVFEFPVEQIALTIEPYNLFGQGKATTLACKVTLFKVTASNRDFAQKICDTIDQVADTPTR